MVQMFAYGTLMRGQCRETCWPFSPQRVEPATTRGELYDLGPYPALVAGDHTIAGELWHFLPEQLSEIRRVIDEVEAAAVGESQLYVRSTVACVTQTGQTFSAESYFYRRREDLRPEQKIQPNHKGICQWPQPTSAP